jgi:hypothetical protein
MDGTLRAESSIIRVSLKPPRSGWVKQLQFGCIVVNEIIVEQIGYCK